MHDEALKQLWKEQRFELPPEFSDEEQIAAMKAKMKGFDRTIFWRDSRESVVAIFVSIFFGSVFFNEADLLRRIGCIIIILSCVFICWYPNYKKRRVPKAAPDAPMTQALGCELRKVEAQIDLLRSVLWWYLLPLGIGVVVFYCGGRSSIASSLVYVGFLIELYGFIYWLNQHAVKTGLAPLKQEIEALLPFQEANTPPEPKKTSGKAMLIGIGILGLALMGVGGVVALWENPKEPRPPAFQNVSTFTGADVAHIDEWLGEQVVLAKYPSLSVAIVRDGWIVYQRAFGFEDIKEGKVATPQTAYHVASVTKAFTASLAMVLHEKGVVNLDAPVVKYLPKGVFISNEPEIGATITLRHLASHTSGLPRGIPEKVQSVEGRYALEPERLYDLLAEVKLESVPGTTENYSNLGFGLLGHVLELAAGKPYERLIQEFLCEPLGLERTAIHMDENLPVAVGYSSTLPRREEGQSYRKRLAASGGLVTTTEDLARFLAAQMKPGLFSSEVLAQLHTATSLSDGLSARTGLGWSIRSNATTGDILQKNGGRNNCTAWIGFSPEHKVGVAIISNCGEPSVDPIGKWLLERSVPAGKR